MGNRSNHISKSTQNTILHLYNKVVKCMAIYLSYMLSRNHEIFNLNKIRKNKAEKCLAKSSRLIHG